MKRNKVFTLLVSALVLLASCNSNDDITTVSTQPSQEANFLGKTAIAFAKSINETNATRATTTYSVRSEEHTSELQSRQYLVCRLLLEKKKIFTAPASYSPSLLRLRVAVALVDQP